MFSSSALAPYIGASTKAGALRLTSLNCIFGPVFHLSVPPDMLEPAHECSLIEAG
jgi:hypothetical protein